MKFDRLLTSGYIFSEEEYSTRLKYILFNSMLLSMMLLLTVAIFIRFFEHNMFLVVLDSVCLAVGVAAFAAVRISRSYFYIAFYIFLLVSYIIVSAAFYGDPGGIRGTGWHFVLLMSISFIRGYREGVIFFLVSLVVIVLTGLDRTYTIIEITTGIMPFAVAYFFIVFFENRNSELNRIVEEQKNLYAYQAKYDKLTNVPNREYFFGFLESALRTASIKNERMAILFIDLDNFKSINDTCGHQIGDRILVETARRLSSQLGDEDMLARLGGDEFAVIVKDATEAEELTAKFRTAMEEPIVVMKDDLDLTLVMGFDSLEDEERQEIDLYIGFSVGSATFPDDGQTEIELMGKADRAMYRGKKRNLKS